jgi:ParB family chromosome partitioning protein
MTDDPSKRKGLGRGLSALLGDSTTEDYPMLDRSRGAREVPIEQLRPNPLQPRQNFDEAALEQLADSIREQGVLQPILVRRVADQPNQYEIIAGERRWRAAQRARLHQMPVVIKDLTDREALEVALIENIQRQDLNAIEEAMGFQRLMQEFGHTQEALAQAIGKSRPHIANLLRLLTLPESVQSMIARGELSAGHARTLVGRTDAEALAKQIAEAGMTVRQSEQLVGEGRRSRGTAGAPAAGAGAKGKDADTVALERSLSQTLGLRVDIRHRDDGGSLSIHYTSLEQLDDLLRRLIRTVGIGRDDEDPLEPGDTPASS